MNLKGGDVLIDHGSSTALKMIKEEPDDSSAERMKESLFSAKRISLNGNLIEKS
jgi:hypothetical protein